MPTDEIEQDRLDLHHEIMLNILEGKVHLAPVRNPQSILDVGTGTGIWAIDAAEKYPSAQVVGTDISPIQPRWVPPNCRFEITDAERTWTFRNEFFDFIHLRNLAQSVAEWDHVLSEVYRCTKPGGWAEHAELTSEIFSDDNSEGPNLKRLVKLMNEGLVSMGRPCPTRESMIEHLKRAGFINVQLYAGKQPFGIWPKDRRLKRIGAMAMLMAETGTEAYAMAILTRFHRMSVDEAKKLCEATWSDIRNRKYHAYNEFLVVYGRKPE